VTLRWEEQKEGSWFAYSGDILAGMVVTQYDGNIHWKIDAVHMKWTAKGYGDAPSIMAAKRALARAWAIWLQRAGLAPA